MELSTQRKILFIKLESCASLCDHNDVAVDRFGAFTDLGINLGIINIKEYTHMMRIDRLMMKRQLDRIMGYNDR